MRSAPARFDASVYVLNMGQPVKIVDLAERMIRLSGLQPGHDIEIVFTGVRPGERLNEILFAEQEPVSEIGIAGIIAAKPNEPSMEMLRKWLVQLRQGIADSNQRADHRRAEGCGARSFAPSRNDHARGRENRISMIAVATRPSSSSSAWTSGERFQIAADGQRRQCDIQHEHPADHLRDRETIGRWRADRNASDALARPPRGSATGAAASPWHPSGNTSAAAARPPRIAPPVRSGTRPATARSAGCRHRRETPARPAYCMGQTQGRRRPAPRRRSCPARRASRTGRTRTSAAVTGTVSATVIQSSPSMKLTRLTNHSVPISRMARSATSGRNGAIRPFRAKPIA